MKIIKVGRLEHIKAMYCEGEVFFNTINYFKQTEKNDARFDKLEGATMIDQIKNMKVQMPDGNILNFSRNRGDSIKLRHAYLIEHADEKKGNIFCCTAITTTNLDSFKKINPKFREFGDSVLLIENPNRFLERIEAELNKLSLPFHLGLTSYYNKHEAVGQLHIFSKSDEYSYQSEIRIWVQNQMEEPIKIKIGPLIEYSAIFSMDELLDL